MNFQLPNYAPPQRFSAPQPAPLWQGSGGAIANGWGAGGDGTGGQQPMMQPPMQQPPHQVMQQSQQAMPAQQPGAGIAQGGSMASFNPSLSNAMQQYPGFGSYLNRGMGGAPSVQNNGVAQPIRGPRRMDASPQFNRIAGVRMP